MSTQIAAAGYNSPVDFLEQELFLRNKMLYNYKTCSILPLIAQSEFIQGEQLLKNSSVSFYVEDDLPIFGKDMDNDEHPYRINTGGLSIKTIRACNYRKLQFKLSDKDYYMLDKKMETPDGGVSSEFDFWANIQARRVNKGIIELTEVYTLAKLLASAAAYNVGAKAGKLTGSYNLGTQDNAGSLRIDSPDKLFRLIMDMKAVLEETGYACGTGDTVIDGTDGDAILVLPAYLERYVIELAKDFSNGCCNTNLFENGVRQAINIGGIKVYTTNKLGISNGLGGVTRQSNAILLDRKMLLHAFDYVTNTFERHLGDLWWIVSFVYESELLKPEAAVVANLTL